MLAALGAMGGGGGLSTQSSSSAEAKSGAGNVGVRFGDNVVGGVKFNPWVVGLVVIGVVAGIWVWKKGGK